MNTQKLTLPLVALMLAMAALTAPVQADRPSGGAATCSIEQAEDELPDTDNIFCQVIAGPGGIQHKSLLSLGLALCHLLVQNTPLACGNTAGSVAGAGGAIYDVSNVAAGTHQLTAWVKQSAGLCGIQGIACGFDINLCNDVDLDGTCTNINDNSDQFQHAQSNEPILGGGYILPAIADLPCVPTVTCPQPVILPTVGGVCNDDGDGGNEGDKGDDKDTKNCGTDDDAGTSFCGKPAEANALPNSDDWNDGQVVTFIGWWIDTWVGWYGFGGDDDGDEGDDDFPTNIGLGLSIGLFDAWLTVGGSCTLPECDDDLDNDDPDNGAIDYPDDPGCDSWKDPDEAPPGGTAPPECNDGISNEPAHGVNDDGLADELDPDCYDFTGPGGTPVYDPNNQETTDNTPVPECANGVNDDADGADNTPNTADDDQYTDADDEDCWSGPGGTYDPTADESGTNDGHNECANGIDDDDDGFTDYPDDTGCTGPTDPDESGGGSFLPTCANLVDDDDDGFADAEDRDCWTADFPDGTYDPVNLEEDDDASGSYLPECSNDFDDDGDDFVDYPADAGCTDALDDSE